MAKKVTKFILSQFPLIFQNVALSTNCFVKTDPISHNTVFDYPNIRRSLYPKIYNTILLVFVECMPNRRPTSSIRFYHEYLVSSANEKHSNGVLNAQYEDAVYKKSLPSLLFLSFGIFLLNSVNEIISRRGVLATARMLVFTCGRLNGF